MLGTQFIPILSHFWFTWQLGPPLSVQCTMSFPINLKFGPPLSTQVLSQFFTSNLVPPPGTGPPVFWWTNSYILKWWSAFLLTLSNHVFDFSLNCFYFQTQFADKPLGTVVLLPPKYTITMLVSMSFFSFCLFHCSNLLNSLRFFKI